MSRRTLHLDDLEEDNLKELLDVVDFCMREGFKDEYVDNHQKYTIKLDIKYDKVTKDVILLETNKAVHSVTKEFPYLLDTDVRNLVVNVFTSRMEKITKQEMSKTSDFWRLGDASLPQDLKNKLH